MFINTLSTSRFSSMGTNSRLRKCHTNAYRPFYVCKICYDSGLYMYRPAIFWLVPCKLCRLIQSDTRVNHLTVMAKTISSHALTNDRKSFRKRLLPRSSNVYMNEHSYWTIERKRNGTLLNLHFSAYFHHFVYLLVFFLFLSWFCPFRSTSIKCDNVLILD